MFTKPALLLFASGLALFAQSALVNRGISDRLNDVRTLRDFGAKGDGNPLNPASGSDDTASINNALKWACAGGDLLIPDGVYRHTGDLTCTVSQETSAGVKGVRIHGSGPNAILLNAGISNGGLSITTVNGTAGPAQHTDFFLSGLHFITATTGTAPYALKLFNQNGFDLSDLVIEGFDKLTDGIQLAGSEMAHVSAIEIRHAQRGWHFTYIPMLVTAAKPQGVPAEVSSIQIIGGTVHYCTGPGGIGFLIESGDVVSIRGIHMFGCARGYKFADPNGYSYGWHNFEIANNHFENNDVSAIEVGDGPEPAATIAGSIAAGMQTVTPSSMAKIHAGSQLLISDNRGSSETVGVTAVTANTFTAVFRAKKAGPGILACVSFEGTGFGPLIIRQNSFYEGSGGHAIDVSAMDVKIVDNIPAGSTRMSGDIVLRPAAAETIITDNHLYSGIHCPGLGGCEAIRDLFLQNNLDRASTSGVLILPDFPAFYRNRIKIVTQAAADGDVLSLSGNPGVGGNHGISIAAIGSGPGKGNAYVRLGNGQAAPVFAGDSSNAVLKACADLTCASPWWTVQQGAFRITQPMSAPSLALGVPLAIDQGGTGATEAGAAAAQLGVVRKFVAGSSFTGVSGPPPGQFNAAQTQYLNGLAAQVAALAADLATLRKGVAP